MLNCYAIFSRRDVRIGLGVACVVAAIAMAVVTMYSFVGGVTGWDEGYQYLQVHYYQYSPMAMLTFWIGHGWTSVFGDTGLSLRWLNQVWLLLTGAIGSLYFWHRTRHGLGACALFLLTMLALERAAQPFYGWDNGAYPFTLATLIATLSYIRSASAYKTVVMGICAATATMARLPLASCLPLLLVVIIFTRRQWRAALIDALVGLASYIVGLAVLMTLMTGSVTNYLSVLLNPAYIINGHDEEEIFSKAFQFTKLSSPVIFTGYETILVAICGTWIISRLKRHKVIAALTVAAIVVIFARVITKELYFAYHTLIGPNEAQATLVLFVTLLFPVVQRVTNNERQRWPWLQIATIAGFIVATSVGSDMLFLRLNMPLYLLPIAITVIWPWAQRNSRRILCIFYSLSFLALACAWETALTISYNIPTQVSSAIPRNAGLRLIPGQHQHNMKVKHAVDSLRAAGLRYEIAGYCNDDKYLFTETLPAGLHQYHWSMDMKSDSTALERIVAANDAVIFVNCPAALGVSLPEFMEERGFREAHAGDGYHLFVRR